MSHQPPPGHHGAPWSGPRSHPGWAGTLPTRLPAKLRPPLPRLTLEDARFAERFEALGPRLQMVVRLRVSGLPSREAGSRLFVCEQTYKNLVTQAYGRLGADALPRHTRAIRVAYLLGRYDEALEARLGQELGEAGAA